MREPRVTTTAYPDVRAAGMARSTRSVPIVWA